MSGHLHLGILMFFTWMFNLTAKCQIVTDDITRFWAAYDQLSLAQTHVDSVATIQRYYLDAASPGFKSLIKHGNFTAEEYVTLIMLYPRFWPSIRRQTLNVTSRTAEIERIFEQLNDNLPDFQVPEVCFAIGCLRVGGTVKKQTLLICMELVDAGSQAILDELPAWRQKIIQHSQGLPAYIAHESIHVQQKSFPLQDIFSLIKHRKLNLLNMAIIEGTADFLTQHYLGLNINLELHAYGNEHECALWQNFQKDIADKPFDYTSWLYNSSKASHRPPDLGYYIGFKISEAYHANAMDKEKATKILYRRGQYRRVLRQSKYGRHCQG